MGLVVISILALAVGPLLHRLAGGAKWALALLDGFVLVTLCGLVLIHVLPHSVALGGAWAIPAAILGVAAPALLERSPSAGTWGTSERPSTRLLVLLLALSGIAVHAFLDGTVMVEHGGEEAAHEQILGLGVVLHRVPVGLGIWWLVRPTYGLRGAAAVVATLLVFSVLGFYFGGLIVQGLAARSLALYQAVVAGSLLHVAFHHAAPAGDHACDPSFGHVAHRHDHGHDHHHAHPPAPCAASRSARFAATIGALAGVGVLLALTHTHPVVQRYSGEIGLGTTFVTLALESAPALLLAYVASGVVHAVLPSPRMAFARGASPITQALRGVLLGPLVPLCSCGVVPLHRSLVARRTPPPAALALLVAAPEVGFSAILVSFALFGGRLAIARALAAVVTALLVGAVIGRLAARAETLAHELAPPSRGAPRGFFEKLAAGLKLSLGEDVDHTAPWLLVGIALASFVEPLVAADGFRELPPGLDVVLGAVVGVPAYVCASGATPLVAVLLHKGLSPGAAVAFLLTGPATNLTTFGLLARAHGRRVALAFGAAMTVLPIGLGYLTNAFLGGTVTIPLHEAARENHPLYEIASLAMLMVMVFLSLARQGPRTFARQVFTWRDEAAEARVGEAPAAAALKVAGAAAGAQSS